MEEKWKPIKGYKGVYEASNLGRIRSVDRYITYIYNNTIVVRQCPSVILKPCLTQSRSPRVVLWSDGKPSNFPIDRLIAETFVANPHNYICIIHKDGDVMNNRASNLEWVPYIYFDNSADTSIWRPVPNYEGIYEISRTGKIRSVHRSVIRKRVKCGKSQEGDHTDSPEYQSRELKPCGVTKKGVKYHLHKRYKGGYYGQTDEYVLANDLVREVFPELFKENNK